MRISPGPVFSGFDHLVCGVGGGAELEIRLDGQLFETEDHRNWSDPGWKTYCPPLAAPAPVRYAAGQRVRQSVELRARVATADATGTVTDGAPSASADPDLVHLSIGAEVVGTVPAIGLGASGVRASAAPRPARDVVRALHPSHLHVELEDRPGWAAVLDAAAEEAADLRVPLDVAIAAAPARAGLIADRVARTVRELGRVSVFSPITHATDAATVSAVRSALQAAGRDVPVGGGSRAHFAELNRAAADVTAYCDFVAYGVTPTVHHDGDDDVLATEAALADALAQAAIIGGGLPVVVGPITLRPRFNAASPSADPPVAGGPSVGTPPGDEPDAGQPDADERQRTVLAAVYLAAAASRLIGAAALTVFRAVGPAGVVTDSGRPTPAAAVVETLAVLSGGPARATRCVGDGVVALAVEAADGELQLLVANRSTEARRLALDGIAARAAVVLATDAPTADGLDPAGQLTLPPRSVALISAVEATAPVKAVAL